MANDVMEQKVLRLNKEVYNVSKKFWNTEDFERVYMAVTMKQLVDVAIPMLQNLRQQYPQKIIMQVCGPITTGEYAVEYNLRELTRAIASQILKGHIVFNQLHFGNAMIKILDIMQVVNPQERNAIILEKFYRPVFASGNLGLLCFIPGSEKSDGCRWERKNAPQYGILVSDLDPKDWAMLKVF